MNYSTNLVNRSQEIARQVIEAEKLNKPIEHLVKEQIKIMELHHDEFVKKANKLGIDNLARAQEEIKIYSMIKSWAKKINLPTQKYDDAMNTIRAKFFTP